MFSLLNIICLEIFGQKLMDISDGILEFEKENTCGLCGIAVL